MKRVPIGLLFLSAVCLLTGCATGRITLFSESAPAVDGAYRLPDAQGFVIEPGDAVNIVFYGQDETTVEPFNPEEPVYVVSADGCVTLPVVGRQRIAGKTEPEAEQALQQAVSQQLRNPLVNVRVTNAQVTVLGEVENPGTFKIDRPVTLLAALGLAGDMLPSARRDNVLIQRQEEGKVKQYRINLLTDELFASPCYYLHKGDVVYVSPRYKANRR